MIRVYKAALVTLLLVCSASVGWAQSDVTGTWEVRLQLMPEYGGHVSNSIWELKQSGMKVSGSITELPSGKVTEFKDGSRGKSGSLDFKVPTQFEGVPASIEVGVNFKDGVFEGLFDVVVESKHAEKFGGGGDNVDTIVVFGKLLGRQATDDSTVKKGEKSKSGKSSKKTKKKIVTEVLFDGKTINNFRGYKQEAIGDGWKVESGTLHFDGSVSGDIITKKEYGSFVLWFEWKISEGGNSGVMYRVKQGDSAPYMTGVEYQILDNDKHTDGNSRSTSAAAIYALYPPGDKHPKRVGLWNKSKIIVKGDKVEHWLNGAKVAQAEIGSDEWDRKIASSKFAKWNGFAKSKRGHIAFQAHGDKVWYRKIRIKTAD